MKFKKILKINRHAESFTLVETLVATWIIMVAILGPLSVAVASSSYARDTKDNMTANYLAQEAIELLRYKRDTIFIGCVNNDSACTFQDNGLGVYENPKESSWRLFKSSIGYSLGPCFASGSECSYDVYGFTDSPTSLPVIYAKGDGNCDSLYMDNNGDGTGSTNFMYLCKATVSSTVPAWSATNFSRTIKVENVTDSGAPQYIKDYENDLRVIVNVKYRKNNGMNKTIKVVDFIHARA